MSVGAVNKQTGDRIQTAGMPAVDSVLSGVSTNPVQNRVVKAAFDGKQDTLTFDDTPTDNSNNPVKSNGIYDALATKADTDMVAADFNAGTSYTAGNYCIYEGKFYKFKNSHSGAWSSADVDEVKITGELSALRSGLTNRFVNLITANAISVANTAKAGTTINKAQLRHDGRFAELILIITNDNAFDTGDTGVMLNIDWSKTGVSFDEFKSACGTCNTSAEYPDFAHAGAISAWTLVNTGDVYMRISESGIKAARLCFVFKLAW